MFLPKNFDGQTNDLILKIAHSKPENTVYWYIEETYIGSTKYIHEMAVKPKQGNHIITVVDMFGNEIKRAFEVTE